ncbi:MAG: glycosyltransferase family 2 protein [archaeon]|nr:glycosyltransferase family 2 protein [archaeon]
MAVEISVVLPCRDEEENVGICVQKAFAAIKALKMEGEVIVVDNGSIDFSARVAKKMGARIIHEKSKGYGAACLAGFSDAKGKIVVVSDADNSYDLGEMPVLVKALKNCDLVVGSRFSGKIKKGAMPALHKYVGNPFLTKTFNILFGTKLTDTHSGFRAMHKKGLDALALSEKKFNLTLEMLCRAAEKKFLIKEVPISYGERKGFSKLNSFRHGFGHLCFMLRERLGF